MCVSWLTIWIEFHQTTFVNSVSLEVNIQAALQDLNSLQTGLLISGTPSLNMWLCKSASSCQNNSHFVLYYYYYYYNPICISVCTVNGQYSSYVLF